MFFNNPHLCSIDEVVKFSGDAVRPFIPVAVGGFKHASLVVMPPTNATHLPPASTQHQIVFEVLKSISAAFAGVQKENP